MNGKEPAPMLGLRCRSLVCEDDQTKRWIDQAAKQDRRSVAEVQSPHSRTTSAILKTGPIAWGSRLGQGLPSVSTEVRLTKVPQHSRVPGVTAKFCRVLQDAYDASGLLTYRDKGTSGTQSLVVVTTRSRWARP